MNLKNELTTPEVNRLRDLCNFTDEEQAVFNLRTRGKSVVEISMVCAMSEGTVKRRLAGIQRKVSRVSQN